MTPHDKMDDDTREWSTVECALAPDAAADRIEALENALAAMTRQRDAYRADRDIECQAKFAALAGLDEERARAGKLDGEIRELRCQVQAALRWKAQRTGQQAGVPKMSLWQETELRWLDRWCSQALDGDDPAGGKPGGKETPT